MEIILVAVLVAGVIAFIAYPLFGPGHKDLAEVEDPLETLLSQRDSAYDALRDLDFDFQMGKLSQSDYASLREKYKVRAAQVLERIDASSGNGKGQQAEAQIEVEVARLRRAKTDTLEAEIARLRVERSSASSGRCKNCGTPYQPEDRYCAKCGNPLTSG